MSTSLKKSSSVTKGTKVTKDTKHSANIDFNLDSIIDRLPQPGLNQEPFRGANEASRSEKKTRQMPATILPPEEHARILKNYTEVSKASWLQIPVSTYVRYIDKNNLLHQGGKLKCFSTSASGLSTLMELIKYNHTSRKRIVIKIDLDKTASIWKLNDRNKKETSVQGGQTRVQVVQPVQSVQNQSLDLEEQVEFEEDIDDGKPITREDDMLNKLGNKLLFEEGDMLKQKVENLESEVFRINEETKKIFILVKRLYRLLEKPL